jgi:hypothetical protein
LACRANQQKKSAHAGALFLCTKKVSLEALHGVAEGQQNVASEGQPESVAGQSRHDAQEAEQASNGQKEGDVENHLGGGSKLHDEFSSNKGLIWEILTWSDYLRMAKKVSKNGAKAPLFD